MAEEGSFLGLGPWPKCRHSHGPLGLLPPTVGIYWNKKKSRNLLEVRRHFNVEVENYYFCQFTILTLFLSFRLLSLEVFFIVKKTITNFLNSLNIYR